MRTMLTLCVLPRGPIFFLEREDVPSVLLITAFLTGLVDCRNPKLSPHRCKTGVVVERP